jgi:tetratricopeptide (TPR) repeat protein
MSLLLDALKKAAEQKAAKEDSAVTQTVSAFDDTLMLDDTQFVIDNTVAFDEDQTEYEEDQTVPLAILGNSESDRKMAAVEVTELTQFDADQAEMLNNVEVTELTQFDADQTEILDNVDITTISDGYDATEIVKQQASDVQKVSNLDSTVLDAEDVTTQLDLKQSLDAEVTIDNRNVVEAAYLAQMDDSRPEAFTQEDITEFIGEFDLSGKTVIPTRLPDALGSDDRLEATVLESPQQGYDNTELEESSLTLIEIDDPTLSKTQSDDATATQITGSQAADTEVLTLLKNNHLAAELKRIDIAEDNASYDDIIKPPAAVDGLANENPVTRRGSASTRTYAPDNYGRTLIKIDKGDASQFLAGMKSESAVLMTPENAQKVFISQSSGQRFNHYKIYSGVAATLLLIIFIIGLFEYEEKSIIIDDSLRALKRDPMPNLPKQSSIQDQASLLMQIEDADVDIKTRALLNNASGSVSEASQTTEAIADDAEASGTIKSGDDEVATTLQSNPITTTAENVIKQPFQLTSKRSVTVKNRLLKEAFEAYQRGDNNAALEKYNRVLTDDPQNRNALLARAAINVQSDNNVKAIKDYQTLLIANPKDSFAMSSLISVASISPSKSEFQLKQMMRDEPLSPHLNFVLANIYGTQNRWQEAQNHYFKALENNPDDPNYAYNLAVSLEHIAKPKVAIVYYQLALANFNNGKATFNKVVVDKRVEILKQL